MSEPAGPDLPLLLLAAATEVIDAVQDSVRAAGFADVRPAHGFAFLRISHGGATVGELAEHLGVTKQAASQLVDELVGKGYAERHPHPDDARARLVVLTERGRACTRAADLGLATYTRRWHEVVGGEETDRVRKTLGRMTTGRHIRPSW